MAGAAIRRALTVALLAILALGAGLSLTAGTARAGGDPGSDVLVYQNLFVAADANVSVAQQLELGELLTAAGKDGFPVRVAVISQPADLGAITALWRKPAAYANFLGTELSLSYTGRLLIVMPNGFGFHWEGHSASAANEVLGAIRIGSGGSGLTAAAETAVQTLAQAAGVRLTVPSSPAAAPAPASAAPGRAPSGNGVPLVAGIAAADVVVAAAAIWIALRVRRRGPVHRWRAALSRRARAVPGTWLAGGFVAVAAAAVVAYAVFQPSGRPAQAQGGTGNAARQSALSANPDLDPGATLSGSAPGFTLTDQFGQPVSLSGFRGKVVLLAFNDAECTTICPLTTTALVTAKEMLGAAGSQVQLLGVDANPKATAVEDVRSYSQLHGLLYQWRYLTGSLAQLQRVWKAYSVGVTISKNETDHEPAIFVINASGQLVKLYLTQLAYSAVGQLGQLLASEVATLLPGHPAVASHLSYAQVSEIGPATPAALPAADGGYVTLGPGGSGAGRQPRLYLFFASWDQEITSLGGQLDALNAYQSAVSQSAAGADGLPGLTAVDEGSVEPSATALSSFLATLGRPLSYPVAIDGSGQVADGYGVQGVPWFVLTSADGKVLWSREVSTAGWLTTAALEKDVRAALARAAATAS